MVYQVAPTPRAEANPNAAFIDIGRMLARKMEHQKSEALPLGVPTRDHVKTVFSG
jgi:hypothetical protein